ncbi:ferric reductase NAD binding domain-containing protein [Trichoderma compactum]
MTILTLLVGLSTTWGTRLTGYEAFRKLHYSLAMVYVGACWGHWEKLKYFMLHSLIFWLIDRGCRLMRTGLPRTADITVFPDPEYGDVYRLDLANNQDPWAIGQHYYLYLPESSIWRSHPFIPINTPRVETGLVKHSYIIRAKHGKTKKIAQLYIKTTLVILTGPYHTIDNIECHSNLHCVVGGTGITYVLPMFSLIWSIKETRDLKWVETELNVLQQAPEDMNLDTNIFVTQGIATKIKSKGKEIRPTNTHVKEAISVESSGATNDVAELVGGLLGSTIYGPAIVFSSGPGAMTSDVRQGAADFNSQSKVQRGQQRYE